MKFFFVRHAETYANAEMVNQDSSPVLSETGHLQAAKLAERFRDLSLDVIVSSPYPRSRQTAEAIASQAGLPIIESDLFTEIRRPSEILGKNKSEPEVIEVRRLMEQHLSDPAWHYSDEENVADVSSRAQRAIQFLETFRGKRVGVVTHHAFMKVLAGVMLFGPRYDHEIHTRMYHRMRVANAGICEFDLVGEGEWQLLAWNEQGHL
jgi:broad specificity phosphatase PhoE